MRARFLAAARPESAAPVAPVAPPTAITPPDVLPRPLTPLIGREGVVDAVADAAAARRDTAAHPDWDPAASARRAWRSPRPTRAAGDFADGAVFVDLAPLRDPALVLPTIAQRLGLDERDATPLRERLLAFLRARHLLLLLDNFEHLVAAREEMLALLEACPRLVVLATSRVALRVRGEREYRVAPLELPAEADAPATLANSRGGGTLPGARPGCRERRSLRTTPPRATVAQICRRLDGLPLAIELAAAWARLLPPTALLARLERRLPLLVGGPHDLPDRQRTMRDAIAWSYDLLDAPEQRLFRRLAVFSGGCTPEAAEAVCAAPGEELETLAGLAALVDKSLLRSEGDVHAGLAEPRLVMLETLREYGLEQLAAHGEGDAARDRHAAYYLALAEAAEPALAGPDGPVWRTRLEREHDNLRAALAWLLGRGEADRALRLLARSGASGRRAATWARGGAGCARRWPSRSPPERPLRRRGGRRWPGRRCWRWSRRTMTKRRSSARRRSPWRGNVGPRRTSSSR